MNIILRIILSNCLRSIILGLLLEASLKLNEDLLHLKVKSFLKNNFLINSIVGKSSNSGSSLSMGKVFELDRYLSAQFVKYSNNYPDFDILQWWK